MISTQSIIRSSTFLRPSTARFLPLFLNRSISRCFSSLKSPSSLLSRATKQLQQTQPVRTLSSVRHHSGAFITPLTGNEIYCLGLKGYRAGEIVVGNSVASFGLGGTIRSFGANVVGGENIACTQLIATGRATSQQRLIDEAVAHGADGVTGVTTQVVHHAGNIEFLSFGSCIYEDPALKASAPQWSSTTATFNAPEPGLIPVSARSIQGLQKKRGLGFISSCTGEELFCVLDMGFKPISIIFGNAAFSRGVRGVFMSGMRTFVRGEVKELSDIYSTTRHLSVARLQAEAVANGANAVLGVRTNTVDYGFTEEMSMQGTGCHHAELPASFSAHPLTSSLTDEETWNVIKMGYTPLSVVLGVSVYSLGFVGGITAKLQDLIGGEVTVLSSLLYEARKVALDKIRADAEAIGADEVLGAKVTLNEIGNGLLEFVAVGTAVKRVRHITQFASAQLPVQALVRDRQTFSERTAGMSAASSRGSSEGVGSGGSTMLSALKHFMH